MSLSKKDLEAARRQIDAIDDDMHDLIMQRAEAVDAVGAAKPRDAAVYRPAREALVMRRLAARHAGRFPTRVLIQIWRELMSAAVMQQQPFSVAVMEGEALVHALARDHFGAAVPLVAHGSATRALDAVAAGDATFALLPLPRAGDTDPWWPWLTAAPAGDGAPRVVGRVPFLHAAGAEGLIVGGAAPAPSGEDEALIALECADRMDAGPVTDACAAAGLGPAAAMAGAARDGKWLTLVHLHDFIAPDDERIGGLTRTAGLDIDRVHWLGAYPTPLDPPH